jgi:hypothetical protein
MTIYFLEKRSNLDVHFLTESYEMDRLPALFAFCPGGTLRAGVSTDPSWQGS